MPANLAKRVPAKPDNGAVVAVAVGPGACPTKSIRWWRVVGGEEVDGVDSTLAEELVSFSGDWILFRLRLGWGGCSRGNIFCFDSSGTEIYDNIGGVSRRPRQFKLKTLNDLLPRSPSLPHAEVSPMFATTLLRQTLQRSRTCSPVVVSAFPTSLFHATATASN